MCVWERELCRQACIRAKSLFLTLEPALYRKLRAAENTTAPRSHKRTSLTFAIDTAWCRLLCNLQSTGLLSVPWYKKRMNRRQKDLKDVGRIMTWCLISYTLITIGSHHGAATATGRCLLSADNISSKAS